MSGYLKDATYLYHPTLAPEGKLFQATAERPIPHPGKGWVGSPADFGEKPVEVTADSVLKAQQAAHKASTEVERLTNEKADALRVAEEAQAEAERVAAELVAEREAHAKTKAELEEARNDVAALHVKLEPLEAEAMKVEGLVEQLGAANQAIADANAEVERLKSEIAKFDRDGNGKAGGSTKKAAADA